MRELNTKLFPFLLLFVVLIIGCRKERVSEAESEEMNNTGVMLNPEMMRLGTFFGDVFSEVVLIHVQAGPKTELQTPALKDLLENTEREQSFFIYNIHQIQTLSPEKISSEITFEEAKALNQESVDMLAKAVNYFQAQNKKVYVLSNTYGSYLTQELILREGPDIADKYLLMAGRLDIPNIIWQAQSEGNTAGFIGGNTPFTGEPSTLSITDRNLNKLIAGLSFKRYTQALAKYDDLSTVTYCFGTQDEEVGSLTQNEQALLKTRRAKVLELGVGHQAAIEGLLDEGFRVAFEEE